MAAITDLATLAAATIAAGDWLVIHDATASTDCKTDATNFHLQQREFTAPTPTTDVFAVDASGAAWVIPDNFVLDVSTGNTFSGALLITEDYTGSTAVILSGGNVVTLIGQTVSSGFSTTVDTANRINIYWSSGVKIQNKRGVSVNLYIIALRTRAG
jgi:hypothetical protein